MSELLSQIATIDDIRGQINATLARIFDDNYHRAQAADPHYGRLWSTIGEIGLAGGKRIRPYLTIVAYRGFGGIDLAILEAAAAQELLHLALLFHDDIMDHDYFRHGSPNVAGRYLEYYDGRPQARHLADSAAMIAGDLLLSLAFETLGSAAFSPDLRTRAVQALGTSMHEVSGGQLLDMEAAGLDGDPNESLKIARLKTASYSFVGPLMVGAILAGAGEADLQAIEELGTAVGIGFQMADDLIGFYGNEIEAGKSIISDLREGKSTYLIRQAFALSSPEDQAWLKSVWGRVDATLADLERARSIAIDSGARQATETVMKDQAIRAHDILSSLKISADAAAALSAMIESAMWRRA